MKKYMLFILLLLSNVKDVLAFTKQEEKEILTILKEFSKKEEQEEEVFHKISVKSFKYNKNTINIKYFLYFGHRELYNDRLKISSILCDFGDVTGFLEADTIGVAIKAFINDKIIFGIDNTLGITFKNIHEVDNKIINYLEYTRINFISGYNIILFKNVLNVELYGLLGGAVIKTNIKEKINDTTCKTIYNNVNFKPNIGAGFNLVLREHYIAGMAFEYTFNQGAAIMIRLGGQF